MGDPAGADDFPGFRIAGSGSGSDPCPSLFFIFQNSLPGKEAFTQFPHGSGMAVFGSPGKPEDCCFPVLFHLKPLFIDPGKIVLRPWNTHPGGFFQKFKTFFLIPCRTDAIQKTAAQTVNAVRFILFSGFAVPFRRPDNILLYNFAVPVKIPQPCLRPWNPRPAAL